MPYPQIYPPEEEGFHPTAVAHAVRRRHRPRRDRSDRRAPAGLDRPDAGPSSGSSVGAMARVPAEATAFAHRASRLMVNVTAIYGRPEEAEVHQAWADRLAATLQAVTPAPTSTSSATRARRESTPPTRSRPGSGWPRSRRATTRPTCSTTTRTSRRPKPTPMTTTTRAQADNRIAGHRRGPAPPRSSHGNGAMHQGVRG